MSSRPGTMFAAYIMSTLLFSIWTSSLGSAATWAATSASTWAWENIPTTVSFRLPLRSPVSASCGSSLSRSDRGFRRFTVFPSSEGGGGGRELKYPSRAIDQLWDGIHSQCSPHCPSLDLALSKSCVKVGSVPSPVPVTRVESRRTPSSSSAPALDGSNSGSVFRRLGPA